MSMRVVKTNIPDLLVLEPDVFSDTRGYFTETYNAKRYSDIGITNNFVQDNESLSMKGVIRGLHWQASPMTQAKLVRVVRGSVLDVAVDIRKNSPTFGQHVAVELSGENHKQFFIPRGFAHGFIVLEDDTLFSYKCDNLYSPEHERGLRFDDPKLDIKWPDIGVELVLSEKDKRHPLLNDVEPWLGK